MRISLHQRDERRFALEDKRTIGDVMTREAMQRVGVLCELPALLRELGADPDAVFAGSGIEPGSLSPELRLPFPQLLHVLERAARITGCPHIGLLLGLRFDLIRHFGLIGQLMHSAPTLKQALVDFVTRQPGYSSGAIVYLNQIGDVYDFGYGAYAVSSPGTRVLYDAVVCIGLRMVDELSKGTFKPVEAHFSHRAEHDRETYSRLLKVPVRFDEPRSSVILTAEAMQATPPRADPVERQRLIAIVREMNLKVAADLATQVRHTIRHQLHYEGPTMAAVAGDLGLHPRTLRRRLADEGETFEHLRDTVRFAVARELIELTGIPVSEVADFLGFSSLAVFSRAFRRWSGASPLEWRRRQPTSWTGAFGTAHGIASGPE
jgi:AraC-like DNA-binding protein